MEDKWVCSSCNYCLTSQEIGLVKCPNCGSNVIKRYKNKRNWKETKYSIILLIIGMFSITVAIFRIFINEGYTPWEIFQLYSWVIWVLIIGILTNVLGIYGLYVSRRNR